MAATTLGNDLLRLSGVALAQRIRSGATSSRAVVDAHIARIEAVNPIINAIIADRFDAARAEADAADARLRDGELEALPPFHGVPCSIKECFALEGMPNSGGLVSRSEVRATYDATAVARMRAAGCIPLGVTNLSELCMWMESNNRVYGRTNNPYDASRIVGGSSGGEGAIIAAGGTPFGLGSDIGGSIRLPAFFNGVFGHKPTGGMVPSTGQYPASEGAALRYLCSGPLARRAEDLFPLLQVMAGPDGHDAGTMAFTLSSPDTVSLEGLKVLDVRTNGLRRPSWSLDAAQQRAADALAARGAVVETTTIPALRKSVDLWATLLGDAQETSFRDHLENGTKIPMAREFWRWVTGRSDHTLPALALAAIEGPAAVLGGDVAKVRRAAEALKAELVDRIGPHGVMLFPSYTRPAPRHGRPMALPIDWVYTAVLNVMELPVTQVPMGLDDEGLPTGVQVAAIHGHDHVSIAAALALEEATGGWIWPAALADAGPAHAG